MKLYRDMTPKERRFSDQLHEKNMQLVKSASVNKMARYDRLSPEKRKIQQTGKMDEMS